VRACVAVGVVLLELGFEPSVLSLDDRGKVTFKARISALRTVTVLLVVRATAHPHAEVSSNDSRDGSSHSCSSMALVPVVSTPIRIMSGDDTVTPSSLSTTEPWLGVNCRLFDMPAALPPIVLLECHGTLLCSTLVAVLCIHGM
jgi:hypothetical protein